MPRQGKTPNRRSQAHLVLLCTGGVPWPTGASLRSLVRGNAHAGFWSRGGQSDLSIDCHSGSVPPTHDQRSQGAMMETLYP